MLELRNLLVQFNDSKNPVIQDFSLKVEKGDRIAILGPSGCGKTTILKVIAGHLNKKDVHLNGVLDWRFQAHKPKIATVFQSATLLPWKNVRNNISLGLKIQRISKDEINERVDKVLKIVGLQAVEKKYPSKLSIGMQQRVNFARALVCEPELLLLDEPFSSLDGETKNKIMDGFSTILEKKGITSIFVTHNLQEAMKLADKIIFLTKSPSIIDKIVDTKNSELA